MTTTETRSNLSWPRSASGDQRAEGKASVSDKVHSATQPVLRVSNTKLPTNTCPVSLLTLALDPCSTASSRLDDLPSTLVATSRVSTASGTGVRGRRVDRILKQAHR